jgi:hypothetical protein
LRGTLRAAFAEQVAGKFLDPGESCLVADRTAVTRLDDQTGRGQEPEMMSERRGREIQALLDVANAQAFGPSADEREKHFEARLRPDRGERLGDLDVAEVTGIVGGFEATWCGDIKLCPTHVSIVLEIWFSVKRVR